MATSMLAQRIGRAHRMGQKRPVQVFILVTDGTIEEKPLGTLAAKHEMPLAVVFGTNRIWTTGIIKHTFYA